jgi:hypothetical protein
MEAEQMWAHERRVREATSMIQAQPKEEVQVIQKSVAKD